MEIHFYESELSLPKNKLHYSGWYETKAAIRNGVEHIITTQMGCMSTRLIEGGYRVFVHPATGGQYEIKLWEENT